MDYFVTRAGIAVEKETDGDEHTVQALFPDGGETLKCTATTHQIIELASIFARMEE